METVTDFIFSKITGDGDCSHGIKRSLLLGRKAMTNAYSILKKKKHYFAYKDLSNQSYCFSSSHIWIWELDHKESWELKNWCFWIVMLEKTPESALNCKEIKPVYPKGNRAWIFLERTDSEADFPILWPPDGKNWPTWKDPDAEKDWRQEVKGMTEWDGWMASLTQWTWVWACSKSRWWTGRPGKSMG